MVHCEGIPVILAATGMREQCAHVAVQRMGCVLLSRLLAFDASVRTVRCAHLHTSVGPGSVQSSGLVDTPGPVAVPSDCALRLDQVAAVEHVSQMHCAIALAATATEERGVAIEWEWLPSEHNDVVDTMFHASA